MYDALLRPLLFALPPSLAHGLGLGALALLDAAPLAPLAEAVLGPPAARPVETMGLRFAHPVGLAGGFDKDGRAPRALLALGFSFLEIGTVTALAQAPNPPPNLFRLPADAALVNRLGFPNHGAERLAARLAPRRARGHIAAPVGISIGKSRAVPVEDESAVIADYVASFRAIAGAADFVVVNVSSPNTANLRALQTAETASRLLASIAEARPPDRPALPILLKVAPDLADEAYDALLDVVRARGLAGVVATNTTVRRDGLATDAARVQAIGAGGLSGPPLRARAVAMVRRARERLGGGATVIGVGGISEAAHAREHLDAGADLVQLYTGFIYGGPLVARKIARELAR